MEEKSELEKLLAETDAPAEKEKEKSKEPEESPEAKAKAEQLANLHKAVEAEQARLKKIREDIRKSKNTPIEEEELPKINFEDPSAKAWDKRIRDASAPAQQELEKAKEERRIFTLRRFLQDKPALAKDGVRLKSMMETYDRIKTSTELTGEGILMDLERAYAAEHYSELMDAAHVSRVEGARNDELFSDAAVSSGSTAYATEKPKKRVYSEEEKEILKQWERSGAPHIEE